MFQNEQLFSIALQLKKPLYVKSVSFDETLGELHLYIDFKKGATFRCPVCGKEELKVHDTKEKTWRHLNFFQYKTYVHYRTPRTKCPEDGVRLTEVPWASAGSGFTLLFEAFVLQLALCMPVSRMAQILEEYDTRLWRVISRYVDTARAEADYSDITQVAIDETSSKKRHNYVTTFLDVHKQQIVHVAEGKDAGTIHSFREMLKGRGIDPEQITHISSDMSRAFKRGVAQCFPEADVTYDKFHVIKMMNEALDKVRRAEQKIQGSLFKTRYLWLYNPKNLNMKQQEQFGNLATSNLKTARAYRIKLTLQDIYTEARSKKAAEILLKKWYGWAVRSRLEPVKEFAKTVKRQWNGILNYFDSRLTNGVMEGMNSIIQSARNRARGYRNPKTFITMIYLLGGKLNIKPLYPTTPTHPL